MKRDKTMKINPILALSVLYTPGGYKNPNLEEKEEPQKRIMPCTVDSIYINNTSSVIISYFDLLLENNMNFLVGGSYDTRKQTMKMFKELAGQYGEVYPASPGILDAVVSIDTPYMEEDCLLVNLDEHQNEDYAKKYLQFLSTNKMRSIAEISSGNLESIVKKMKSRPLNASLEMISEIDTVIIPMEAKIDGKQRAIRTKQVVDILCLDTNSQLLTNEVFRWDPETDEYEFSGKSYVMERIMKKNEYSKEKIIGKLKKRKEKFDRIVRISYEDYNKPSKSKGEIKNG